MRNKKLIPFEVIENAVAGEPEKAVKDKIHACALNPLWNVTQ